MDVIQPSTWDEALAARADRPDALPLLGGTDVLVDLNFDRRRPGAILDLSRVPELRGWRRTDGTLRLAAGLTYTEAVRELPPVLPGLAIAARSVGSPQIRNRGTIGGNLGSASPAGDALPPLLAAGAEVELASAAGARRVPFDAFFRGYRRTALEPDELIAAVHVPVATGPQQFSKIGTRNAMVIAVCSFALVLDGRRRRVGTGIGSAGPVPLRARDAEDDLAERLGPGGLWDDPAELPDEIVERFGALVAAAARPIDDVRGSAAYRRHALAVMAARTLRWAWRDRPWLGAA